MKSILHIKHERILFSPLNWGMGHVSRSIPLLRTLCENENEITIACTLKHREIYEEYLVGVKYVGWDGYPFQFGEKGNFAWDMLRSFFRLKRFGKEELKKVESLRNENDFTMIVSDNRYYFRSKEIHSVFVTHQVALPLPWYLKVVQSIHYRLINQFDELWIVDDDKIRLAGKLSEKVRKIKIPAKYIGLLSRFKNIDNEKVKKGTTILISGPEPYANQFYQSMLGKLSNTDSRIIYKGQIITHDSTQTITWKEIDKELLTSDRIVARSGYSTLMDVHFLSCETEWHPTLGQWEQEYLAEIHR